MLQKIIKITWWTFCCCFLGRNGSCVESSVCRAGFQILDPEILDFGSVYVMFLETIHCRIFCAYLFFVFGLLFMVRNFLPFFDYYCVSLKFIDGACFFFEFSAGSSGRRQSEMSVSAATIVPSKFPKLLSQSLACSLCSSNPRRSLVDLITMAFDVKKRLRIKIWLEQKWGRKIGIVFQIVTSDAFVFKIRVALVPRVIGSFGDLITVFTSLGRIRIPVSACRCDCVPIVFFDRMKMEFCFLSWNCLGLGIFFFVSPIRFKLKSRPVLSESAPSSIPASPRTAVSHVTWFCTIPWGMLCKLAPCIWAVGRFTWRPRTMPRNQSASRFYRPERNNGSAERISASIFL